jgi:hypothetical protein
MSIDLNDKIKLWGGFSQGELYLAGGVLVALFFLFFLGLSKLTGDLPLGFAVFCGFAGPWIWFVMYRRDLPKGYLLRRFRQEGKFLFLSFGAVKGIDVYAPPTVNRVRAWAADFEEGTHGD